MFLSWTDTSQDVYTEEKEVGESKTNETFLVQQKPVSRAKLEARTDSKQVQHLSSYLLMYCQPSFKIVVWWLIKSDLELPFLTWVASFYKCLVFFLSHNGMFQQHINMLNDVNLQANTETCPQEILMGFKKSTKQNYVSFDNINPNNSKVDIDILARTHSLKV